MSQQARVFRLFEIRALGRDPAVDLDALHSGGSGFSYPQAVWLHQAVAWYYANERTAAGLADALHTAMSRGAAMTPWKAQVERNLQVMLEAFLKLDRVARGHVELVAFEPRPSPVAWQGHLLRVPLGLICSDGAEQFMRLLWTQRYLGRRHRGVPLVAAASMAAAESVGPLSGIEGWHLRDAEGHFFSRRDLQLSLRRLDRLLRDAERRMGSSRPH